MNIEARASEIAKSIKSVSKDVYHKTEVLPELLSLQQEIVNLTFNDDHANLGNLKIWDVENHFEQMNELYDGIADIELAKFKSGSKTLCNLIKAEFSGNQGESKAFGALNRIKSNHVILKNVELSDGESRTEIDATVITNKGVFIIEVKNTHRDIFIDEKGDYYRIGEYMRLDSNILDKLNVKHQLLEKALTSEGLDHVNIFEIVVFTNNHIEVNNRCDSIKTSFLSRLPYMIDEWKNENDYEYENLHRISDAIEKARHEEAYPLEFDVSTYKNDFACLMAKLEAASQNENEVNPVKKETDLIDKNNLFNSLNRLFSKRNFKVAGSVAAVAGIVVTVAIGLKDRI